MAGNGGFRVMVPIGQPMERYHQYLEYVESGEPKGTMSYEEWLDYVAEAL